MMEKRLIQSIVIAAALILLTVGAMPEAPKRTGHTTAGAVSHIVPTLSDFTPIEEREETVEIAEEPVEEIEEEIIEEIPVEQPAEEIPVEVPVYAPEPQEKVVAEEIPTEEEKIDYSVLNKRDGVNYYGGQKETYYNLRMTGVIRLLDDMGIPHGEYWIRDDGCKMLGDYIMLATDTNRIPKGTVWETSLGTGMIVDHCSGSESYPGVWIDVAVSW